MTGFFTRQVIMMSVGEMKPFMSLVTSPLGQPIRRKCCQNTRLFSNSPPPSSSVPSPAKPSGGGSEGNPAAKLSLFARFKQMYKDYYYVLIPVHLVTSIGWFGSFYQASQR